MLTPQFLGQNLHFAINLFAALTFAAMGWLYLDAWSSKKQRKELFKWIGFITLALAFLISGTIIQDANLFRPVFGKVTAQLAVALKVAGSLILALGLIIDPLPKMVENEGLVLEPKPEPASPHKKRIKHLLRSKKRHHSIFGTFAAFSLQWMVPVALGLVGWLFWRRSTKGLERHLKTVAIGFFIVTASQAVALSSLWRSSTNPTIFNFVAPYSFIWYVEQLLLLAGIVILARWVWSYLVKRLFSQLFMVFTSIAVLIFLITTVSFSYLLSRNIQSGTLSSLESSANSLKYAIDAKQTETLSSAEVIGQNPEVIQAIQAKDRSRLVGLAGNYLAGKNLSSVIITNNSGQVLVRAEDPGRWGDSISDDVMMQRAVSGLSSSSMVSKQDVIAPLLYFQSSVPIRQGEQIIGSVIVGVIADNAFVDGIKQATGLDSTVFSANVRSATTLIAPDGKSRWIGIKETNKKVNTEVLDKGQTFSGTTSILNQPYLAVYVPLKDVDNKVVGMLFVGRPQTYVMDTASRSIELTFLITAVLLVLSVYPAFYVARYIERQLS